MIGLSDGGSGGRIVSVLALDIVDGRISAIRGVLNPDKLHDLGSVVWPG